jgi:hypothetical protein
MSRLLAPAFPVISTQAECDALRKSCTDLISKALYFKGAFGCDTARAPAVVDLFAAWAGPCLPLRMLAPAFPEVRFVSVDSCNVEVFDHVGERLPETAEPTFVLLMVRVLGRWAGALTASGASCFYF